MSGVSKPARYIRDDYFAEPYTIALCLSGCPRNLNAVIVMSLVRHRIAEVDHPQHISFGDGIKLKMYCFMNGTKLIASIVQAIKLSVGLSTWRVNPFYTISYAP